MTNSGNGLKRGNLLMLAGSVGVGLLSGSLIVFAIPEVVLRGAILALSLSFGLIAINRFSKKRLLEGMPPTLAIETGIGILSGLLPGLTIAFCTTLIPQFHDPDGMVPALLHGWNVILLCVCYGVALNLAYALRWNFHHNKGLLTMVCIAGAGFLCGGLRGYLERSDDSSLLLLVAAFTGLPFSVLWGLAVIALDPAWTTERWQAATSSK